MHNILYIRPLSILFSLVLFITILCEWIQSKILPWIVKPLLMPLLLTLFILNFKKLLSIERICFILALIFSWLGDILLMLNGSNLFIFGLVAFLIAHISYIISFVNRIKYEVKRSKYRLKLSTMLISAIPYLVYIAFMLAMVIPSLTSNREGKQHLLIPVIIYAFCVVGMAYTASLRDLNVSGFWTVVLGTIFFVGSDSILAINKFVNPFPLPDFFIMLTYGIGQYLITVGTLQVTCSTDGECRSNITDN